MDKARAYADAMAEAADAELAALAWMSRADLYVWLAIQVATAPGGTRESLRRWWVDETDRRREYGLSQAQEDEIADACRAVLEEMPEGASEPKPRTETRRPPPRREAPKKRRYGS